MSDGPHRSLPLRPKWRKVAERADLCAYTPADIAEAIEPALYNDWRNDVPADMVRDVRKMMDGQTWLFGDRVAELEKLRSMAAGRGLANLFLDCVLTEVRAGNVDSNALASAATTTLRCWASANARAIEEHYLRKARSERSRHVRCGLDQGIATADLDGLGRKLVGLDAGPVVRTIPKHDGIDDGVSV